MRAIKNALMVVTLALTPLFIAAPVQAASLVGTDVVLNGTHPTDIEQARFGPRRAHGYGGWSGYRRQGHHGLGHGRGFGHHGYGYGHQHFFGHSGFGRRGFGLHRGFGRGFHRRR